MRKVIYIIVCVSIVVFASLCSLCVFASVTSALLVIYSAIFQDGILMELSLVILIAGMAGTIVTASIVNYLDKWTNG